MKLTVKAGGTIPTGQYQNYQPEYIVELDVGSGSQTDKDVEQQLRAMRDIVEKLYAERDRKFRTITAQLAPLDDSAPLVSEMHPWPLKIRWYPKDGKAYPSVTSILSPYGLILDEGMLEGGWTDEDIEMYALRGTIVHAQMEEYMKTGKWMDMKTHPDYAKLVAYRSPIITEEKALLPEKCNFKGFLDKYGTQLGFDSCETKVYYDDPEFPFAGTYDLKGNYQGARAIMDVKTASSYKAEKKDQYFEQMAGYDIAGTPEGQEYAKVYVTIPLNPKNKCGFGAPIVCANPAVYRKRFLDKVKDFYCIHGVKEEKLKEEQKLLLLTKV